MEIRLTFQAVDEVVLPLNYNRYIQGAIYDLLSNQPEYSSFLHNKGYENGSLKFRLFTFGALKGKYKIANKNILFGEKIYLEIRSISDEFIRILMKALYKRGSIILNGQSLLLTEALIGRYIVLKTRVQIETVSPIVISKTLESGFRRYYSPEDAEFAVLANDNFIKKYYAFYKELPAGDITLTYIDGSTRHVVTKYKQTIINAYHGHFILEGNENSIQFLYDTGLGSKNAQGFGLFDIM